jgi:hypothetical protein
MLHSTLVVTTPANATALTTLERVKAELEISGNDSDDLLQSKINEASSDIEARCRPFRRETVTETFWPARPSRYGSHGFHNGWNPLGHGIECLSLLRRPVANIASITVDDTAVVSTDYRIDADSGLLFRLDGGYGSAWWISKTAVVAYSGGYLLPGEANRNLPPSLESAAVDLVGSYWMSRGRDPKLRAETSFGVASFEYWVGAVGDVGDLPPGVMAKIAPFRKMTVA